MDNLPKVLYIWVLTHVIIDGSQLDQLAQKRNVSLRTEVLMTDDRLADSFGLVLGRAPVLKKVEGLETALKFEGEAG